MFLQTSIQNRRKFLERSMLGFGSAFLLPSLLASCTDHNIPSPGELPNILPTLVDSALNWNDTSKIVVSHGLELIPEAGEILGPLAEIFWPKSKEDVWGQVKGQVEAVVNQKIAAAVYQQVSDDLQGLNNSTVLYLNELKNGSPAEILTQWQITKTLFVDALPHFKSAGNELPLLGLFAQFANMYLTILRDPLIPAKDSNGFPIADNINGNPVLTGKTWGRTDADQQQDITDLKDAITSFTTYTTNTYNTGRQNVVNNTKPNNHLCEPFRSVNAYVRPMTLTVLDYMNTWSYYDVTLYPTGTKVELTREIYSDPYGTCDNSGNIVIATPVPTQRPTQLSVWGWDRIDAVQLTYPAGSGPGGVTQTKRMGDQSGGSNQDPHGGIFNISPDNPIIQAGALYGDIVNALQFKFNDGTLTKVLGGGYVDPNHKPIGTGPISYTNEAMSSVHINGVSSFYDSADCAVFGFQYWQSPSATLYAIRTMYVQSPKERSLADFVKAYPNLAIPAGLITPELKAARLAHWAYVEARAKALK